MPVREVRWRFSPRAPAFSRFGADDLKFLDGLELQKNVMFYTKYIETFSIANNLISFLTVL